MPSTRRARDAADDPLDALKERLRTMLASRDFDEVERLIDACGERADDDLPKLGGALAEYAMDSASPTRRVSDLLMAIEECAPVVGRHVVLGQDSAAGVFRAALGALGVEARTVHASALPVMFRAARRSGSAPAGHRLSLRPAALAMDTATDTGFAKRFPAVARIRSL